MSQRKATLSSLLLAFTSGNALQSCIMDSVLKGSPPGKVKLLDQVRGVIRVKHYSLRTEQTYLDWFQRLLLEKLLRRAGQQLGFSVSFIVSVSFFPDPVQLFNSSLGGPFLTSYFALEIVLMASGGEYWVCGCYVCCADFCEIVANVFLFLFFSSTLRR